MSRMSWTGCACGWRSTSGADFSAASEELREHSATCKPDRDAPGGPDPQPLDAQSLYDELNAVVQRSCLQEGGAILAVDVIGTVLADIFHACPRRQRDDLIARLSDSLRQGMKLAEAKGLIQ